MRSINCVLINFCLLVLFQQGASKLELLLKEKETLNVLDYYSERKSASSQRNITWDLVVGKVSKFVARELEQKSVSEAKIKVKKTIRSKEKHVFNSEWSI